MNREDLLLKRQRIERGNLPIWSRRGRSYHRHKSGLRDIILRHGLNFLRLYERGESNVHQPVIKHLHFSFDALPQAFDGFTILHLSDLHVDSLDGLPDSLYEHIEGIQVDLCALTGDYRFKTRGDCHQIYPKMARILSGVQARHGVAGVLGNHDSLEMVPELERLGVKMLLNDAVAIQQQSDRIWVVGVDDPHYYGCDSLPLALSDVPSEEFKLLLVHSPELFADAATHNIQLYLCGHTHGGQICIPWLGPVVTNANCPRTYVRGRWQYRDVQGYTSSGTGASGVPVRFFCPPEIGLITLHRTAPQPTQPQPSKGQQQVIPSL